MKPSVPWNVKPGEFDRWFDWHVERQRKVFARLDRLRSYRRRQCWTAAAAYVLVALLFALVVLVYGAEFVGGFR